MATPIIQNERDRVAVRAYIDAQLNGTSYLLEGVKGATTGRAAHDRERLGAEIDRLLQTRRDLCGDAVGLT
jgi:hypothetical protein